MDVKKILCLSLFLSTALINLSFAEEQPFELILVIPRGFYQDAKSLYLNPERDRPSFHVILKNISQYPQLISGWSCSSTGFPPQLFFKVTYNGQEIDLFEKGTDCWGNPPRFWLIDAQEYYIFDIYFKKEWTEIFSAFKENEKIKLKAIFKSQPADDKCDPKTTVNLFYNMCKKYNVYKTWEGQVESNVEEATIY